MYIMTGTSISTGKTWYQLVVIEKNKNNNVVSKSKIFISSTIYQCLKDNGIKVYANTCIEVK